MPTHRIDELIWTALTDSVFREGLLNGHRRELVAGFNLTEAESKAVLSVKADTLEAFAEALCQQAAACAIQSDPASGQPDPVEAGDRARGSTLDRFTLLCGSFSSDHPLPGTGS